MTDTVTNQQQDDQEATGTEVSQVSAEVFNATPLPLMLTWRRLNVGQVGALDRLSRAWPTGAVELRAQGAPRNSAPLGVLKVAEGQTEFTIRPEDLRSAPADGLPPVAVTFVNDTAGYLDLFTVDADGATHRLPDSIAPGARSEVQGRSQQVWAVRSTFTNELIDLVWLDDSPVQTRTVTNAHLARVAEALPLPSPLPEVPAVTLIGGVRERPRPESRDYILVSQQENREKARFNTRLRVVTRTVQVAGVKLVWNSLDKDSVLMPLQGPGVLDLESIDMYADTVVIASPLRFPGTDVTIHARRLEFTGDGQIDTTPMGHAGPARSGKHDDKGRPVDAKSKPTYRAVDGLPGEAAGDIEVLVSSVTVPPGSTQPRFVARGSAGQRAEEGGVKDYAARLDTQPAVGKGKTLSAVTEQAVADQVRGAGFAFAKELSDWRWPGEVSAGDVSYQGEKLLSSGKVVDLVVVAHDDTAGDTNVFFFPGQADGTIRRHSALRWDNAEITHVTGVDVGKPALRVPGDGEDAYPGGKPGDGGSGGRISTSLPLAVLEPLCDASGGAAGPETPAVPGEEAGGPHGALHVQMDVVKKAWWESSRGPQLTYVRPVGARHGDPAPARQGSAGPTLPLAHSDVDWLSAEIVDAVLACARDAYRKGHRDLARSLLEPYYAVLRDGVERPELPLDVESRAIAVNSLVANLQTNLDYFGNPSGWVPRLRLSSNFEAFATMRQASLKLLYYAMTMEQKYDDLQHKEDLADQTAKALESELTETVAVMARATEDLARARRDVLAVKQKVQDKQNEIDLLKHYAEQESLQAMERQRIFRGVAKLVGGVMKVCPVGQPYVGLGGDIASAVGDIDITDPKNLSKSIGDAIGKVGGATETFIASNQDLIADDLLKSDKKQARAETAQADSLTDQLARARGASANLEKSITARTKPIESAWTDQHKAEVESLKASIKDTETTIATYSAKTDPGDEEKKRLAAAKEADYRLKARLGATEAANLTRHRAQLGDDLAALDELIAEEKDAAAATTATANAERLAVLEKEKSELLKTKQRVDELEDDQRSAKSLEKEHKDALAVQEREMKQSIGRLKKMGSGITAVGGAVTTLMTPATTADADVQAFAAKLLTSQHAGEYQKVIKDFEVLGGQLTAAMERLQAAQQTISTNVAGVADNLATQVALTRQRAAMGAGLDIRAKRYLQGMQSRAKDVLLWSKYHLVMSYRYEFLKDVSNSFYDHGEIVQHLQDLEVASDAATRTAVKPALLAEAKWKEIDDTVLRNEFLGEAAELLKERQSRAVAAKENTWGPVQLSDEQLERLRLTGRVTFNPVRDLEVGTLDWINARIVKITLSEVVLETAKPRLGLRFTFQHSGESVLLGRDPRTKAWTYFYFRCAPGDDPIEWGFGYSHGAAAVSRVKGDEKKPEADAMIKKVLAEASGTVPQIEFHEYSPALFSDLTLHLTSPRSKPDSTPAASVSKITKVEFSINYTLTGERHD